ncbi:MAG: 4-hydroxythreonine-4-phosphate dehydrogenase PdxA [Filomicrobium sp.]
MTAPPSKQTEVEPEAGGFGSARLPLAVTMGDPAGIGPELILEAWHVRGLRELPSFCVYANLDMLRDRASAFAGGDTLIEVSDPRDAISWFDRALPVVDIPLRTKSVPGQPDTSNASAVLTSIEACVEAVFKGQACAVVTNPIAKSVLYGAGFRHPGHTEYLAALSELHSPEFKGRPVMMLACDELMVVPATIHIPLHQVASTLNAKLLEETIEVTCRELQERFGIEKPRISVCGLNPHAGEDGALGREEIDVIAPALQRLRDRGLDVAGPLPADTMFHAEARSRYDVAVAMYHDQALIPIKTLAFDKGVNVTLGLPFVRTSPDHGTAFDIAGHGKASPESFIQALLMAERMAIRPIAKGPVT